MSRFIIPVLFVITIGCSGQFTNKNELTQNKSNLKKSDLQGHWKFVSVEEVKDSLFLSSHTIPPAHEQRIELPYKGPDLIFEKDTMREIYYPKYFGPGVYNYSVYPGYLLHHINLKWGINDSLPIEMENDTLFIYKNSYSGGYLKEGYIRTTFNDTVLNLIKRYGANYPEMAGTWFLIREIGMNDGSDPWILQFPHRIPDSIVITKQDFETTWKKNRIYMMSTDGKKRDYEYSYCGYGWLCLTPGKWYKGEDPWIHFEQKVNR